MSTNYSFLGEGVTEEQLLKAAKKCNIVIAKRDKSDICLTNGTDHLWFYANDDKQFYSATRWGNNYGADETILEPIMNELDIEWASEDEVAYQEYMSQDEVD